MKDRKTPDILFIFPVYSLAYRPESFRSYIGSSYIRAFLKQKGMITQQFYHDKNLTTAGIVRKILDYHSDIIGFTCYDTNYYYVKLLAEAIKKADRRRKIILGGPTATSSYRLIMQDCPSIDICFRGEAESSVYEMLMQTRDTDLSGVKGITFRQGKDICRTETREIVSYGPEEDELDLLPSPYLTGIIDEEWRGDLGIQTVRGCAFACTYCNFSGTVGRRLRTYSLERIIAELKVIRHLHKKLPNKWILIYDENFGGTKERAGLICRAMIKANIRLPFFANIRAESVDRDLLKMMREIGFSGLNIGLESANPGVLRNIDKVSTFNTSDPAFQKEKKFIARTAEVIKWALEENLAVKVSIIQGLPGEGVKEAKETLEFVKKTGAEYYHNHLKIFPGTRLFEDHKRFGIRIEKSAAVLPYKTIPAYNPDVVPPLKNSDVYQLGKAIARQKIAKYWGIWNDGKEGNANQYVLIDGFTDLNRINFKWLRDNLLFFDNIAFRSFVFRHKEAREDIIKKLVEERIPSTQIYFFVPLDDTFSIDGLGAENWKLEYTSLYKPFHCVSPVIKRVSPSLPDDGAVKSEVPGIQLMVSFLKSSPETGNRVFLQDMIDKGKSRFEKLLIEKGVVVEDGCRWAPAQCPAVDFSRILVGNKGGICPCFSAEITGESWCSTIELREKIRHLMKKEKIRRGCYKCPVETHCSKCLFTRPFTNQEFCKIKRETNWSSMLAQAHMLNRYEWFAS